MAPSTAAPRWLPGPLASSSNRANEIIGNLIGTALNSADLHRQLVHTVRILDARLALFEHHVNRKERNLNYLVLKLKNWVGDEAEETPEDELLRLRTAILHIPNRIGDIDPEGFGYNESDSDRTVRVAISVGQLSW